MNYVAVFEPDHFQSTTFFTDIWQILSIKIQIRERLLWLIFERKIFHPLR